jgi:hypothetical protein
MKTQSDEHKHCKSAPYSSFMLAVEPQPEQKIHDMIQNQLTVSDSVE